MNSNFGVSFILCHINLSAGNGLNSVTCIIKKVRGERSYQSFFIAVYCKKSAQIIPCGNNAFSRRIFWALFHYFTGMRKDTVFFQYFLFSKLSKLSPNFAFNIIETSVN